jgi:flagellar protein FliS
VHGSKNVAGQSKYILKTQDIINELSLALDMKQGGEVAKTLDQLVQNKLVQLLQAHITSDKLYLESVIKVLSPLRDAWSRISESSEAASELPEPIAPGTRFAGEC